MTCCAPVATKASLASATRKVWRTIRAAFSTVRPRRQIIRLHLLTHYFQKTARTRFDDLWLPVGCNRGGFGQRGGTHQRDPGYAVRCTAQQFHGNDAAHRKTRQGKPRWQKIK